MFYTSYGELQEISPRIGEGPIAGRKFCLGKEPISRAPGLTTYPIRKARPIVQLPRTCSLRTPETSINPSTNSRRQWRRCKPIFLRTRGPLRETMVRPRNGRERNGRWCAAGPTVDERLENSSISSATSEVVSYRASKFEFMLRVTNTYHRRRWRCSLRVPDVQKALRPQVRISRPKFING